MTGTKPCTQLLPVPHTLTTVIPAQAGTRGHIDILDVPERKKPTANPTTIASK